MPVSRRELLRTCGALAIGGALVGSTARVEALPNTTARLNHNENPFGPSQRAREALSSIGDGAWRYAYEEVFALRTLIAQQEGVRPENVFVSEGSAEILKVAATIHGKPGARVLTTRPTFAMLPEYAARQGATIDWVDVNERLGHDFDALRGAITDATRLVYVCNPNNPTGSLADRNELRSFVHTASKQALVVVDEAYIDFADEPDQATLIDQVRAGVNVLITRSFSKLYGLAGLRIGYGLARPDIVRQLESFRISIPNQAGLAAARASLGDAAFKAATRQRIRERAAATVPLFRELGLRFAPTQTNFIMFDTRAANIELIDFARERHVLVAPVAEPFTTWVRVSMGRPEDMQSFARTLREFMQRT